MSDLQGWSSLLTDLIQNCRFNPIVFLLSKYINVVDFYKQIKWHAVLFRPNDCFFFFFCRRSTDLLECLRKQVVLTIKRPRPGDRWDSTLAVASTMLTTFTRLSLLTSLPKEHSTTWRLLSPEIHANQRWPTADSKPSQSTCQRVFLQVNDSWPKLLSCRKRFRKDI